MIVVADQRIRWIEKHCIVPNTGNPIRLEDFQKSFIHKVYALGIITAGLSIPRGNGKTGLLACIALAELFCNLNNPDVALAALTIKQASRPSGIYGVCVAMVKVNPDLLAQVQVVRNNNNAGLYLKERPGQIEVIAAKDPDSLLGGSWSLAIVDEFGSDFWTDERWGNIVQSCGKRGDESRVIGISTPNSPRSAMFSMRNKLTVSFYAAGSNGTTGSLDKRINNAVFAATPTNTLYFEFKQSTESPGADNPMIRGYVSVLERTYGGEVGTARETDITFPVTSSTLLNA